MVQLKTVGERPSPRPAGRPRDTALDEAILAAALLQLGERGYDGMSLEGVAATAGTTVPSLRRRYRGKHQLTVAAIDSIRIEPPPRTRGDPRTDALAMLQNLRANMLKRNAMATLATILAEERRNPELLEHYRQQVVEPQRERLRQALSRGVAAGQLPATLDLDAAVSLLIGGCYASYLHTRRIPATWAETALATVWPPPT